jgi:two-component system, sensor histidine kinase and response regulator
MENILSRLQTIAGLDVNRGLKLAAGRETLYVSILGKFVSSQHDFVERFQYLASSDNSTETIRLAHTLKGTAGQIGAKGVQVAAEKLECALRASTWPTDQSALLGEIADQLNPLITAIATALQASQPTSPASTFDQLRFNALCDHLAELLATNDHASHQILIDHSTLLQAGLGDNYSWICAAAECSNYAAALAWLIEARQARIT